MAQQSYYRPVLVYTQKRMEYDCNDLADYVAARLRASGIHIPADASPQDLREALASVHLLPIDHPAAERILAATPSPNWPRIVLTDRRRRSWEQLLKFPPVFRRPQRGSNNT